MGRISALTVSQGTNTTVTVAELIAQHKLKEAFIGTTKAAWGALAPYAPLIVALGAIAGAAYLVYKDFVKE
jgi:hypothetical protein